MIRPLASALVLLLPALASGQAVTLGAGDDLGSGVLVGRVCQDLDKDGTCGTDEPGLARARVVLDDGTFAMTDREGRYHLVAIPARPAQLQRSAGADGAVVAREGIARRRVKLDRRTLGAGAEITSRPAAVLDFPPASMQQLDFAVALPQAAAASSLKATEAAPPSGEVKAGRYRYLSSGMSAPGHEVDVEGVRATVGADGVFAAVVPVEKGGNTLRIADLSPDGTLAFFVERVDVIPRGEGDVLFVPRGFRRLALLHLPRASGEVAGTPIPVTAEAPPGTKLRVGEKRVSAGPDGTARLDLVLGKGRQTLPVELETPDGVKLGRALEVAAESQAMATGLLSVELAYDPTHKEVSFQGSGNATVERSFGELDLVGGVNLDTGDGLTLTAHGTPRDRLVLLRPRTPYAVERALDPELVPPNTGDDGLSGALNPSRSRLFLSAKHPDYGQAQLGSFHADQSGVEFGRYSRSLFGGKAEGRLPLGPVTLRAGGFGAPASAPDLESQPVPAHDEQLATGGSLYYLHHPTVVPGSEKLRVEVRDGATGLPLDERALVRDVDYSIDYRSGRVLLARPLPMALDDGPFISASPMQGHRPVLVADYEHRAAFAPRNQVVGGSVGGGGGPVEVGATVVRERRFERGDSDYALGAAHARVSAGALRLTGEIAQSQGSMFDRAVTGGFSLTDTGGFTFLESSQARPYSDAGARAGAVRLSYSTDPFGGQLWLRSQQAGFSDSSHAALVSARQVGGRARANLGPVELTAFGDDRRSADPRAPFGTATLGARDAALRAAFSPLPKLKAGVEGTFASLDLSDLSNVGADSGTSGGRAGVGARADYQLVRELSVNASHHQKLYAFGTGPGSTDDTFSAIGATYRPIDDLGLSLRGGWGPFVGTQVQAGAERVDADEVAFGSTTVDVDGPDAGRMTAVSGARKRVDEDAAVFAEELFARDVDALRLGRAVGIELSPAKRLGLSARYERGLRMPLFGGFGLLRDTGGLRASWLVSGLRLSASGELRRERGASLAETSVDRWQSLGTLGVEARPFKALGLTGRLNLSKTTNLGRLEAQLIEGTLGAGLRMTGWSVVGQGSVVDELPAPEQTASLGVRTATPGALAVRRRLYLVSLKPAADIGNRFRLGSGFHAGMEGAGHAPSAVVAASLRPSVRVVGDLEAALEGAVRSGRPAGDTSEELNAVRAEMSYWVGGLVGVSVGYNLYGFAGNGVVASSSQRLYLRVEAAY